MKGNISMLFAGLQPVREGEVPEPTYYFRRLMLPLHFSAPHLHGIFSTSFAKW
jgi:hypothetical protein